MKSIFNKKNLPKLSVSIVFLALLFFIDVNVIFKSQLFPLMGTISLVYFLMVPGYLITRILNLKGKFGEILGYSVVLSITSLIFLGLAINNILPMFNFIQPLSTYPFLISSNTYILVLFAITIINGSLFDFKFKRPKVNKISIVFSVISFCLPILAIAGTNILKNGGPNGLLIALLIGICFYLLLLIILRKHLQDFVYPFSIFFISLTLLYMYSMRTTHLMGWDIQTEYKVFELTKIQYQWTILNYHNAYNATLGITILPTILSNLITIKDIYIFKMLFPLLFSFSSIGVYYLLSRYLSRTAAYLATFFFVIQLSYASMPSLARQEIAYLAFTYTIFILFDKTNSKLTKQVLFLLLGITVIVSHYTTTYIMVGLFISTYIVSKFIQLNHKIIKKLKPKISLPNMNFNLYGLNVLVLLLFTIFWYGIYTNASSNIRNFAQSVYDNISKIQTQEGRSGQSWITINGKQRDVTGQDLDSYIKQYTAYHESNLFYPSSIYSRYPVLATPNDYIPYSSFFNRIPELIVLIDRQIIKLIIIVGILFVNYLYIFKRKDLVSIEWLIMSNLYLGLIILAIFIPKVSAQYNMERLYQQGLIFLSLFPVLLFKNMFKRVSTTTKYLMLSMLFIIYFFSYHGIIVQVFGGLPFMNVNNFGAEYDRYYIHDSELNSARWLNGNRNTQSFVFLDKYAELRLSSDTNISNLQKQLIPSAIRKDSYIYATEENVLRGRVQATYNNTSLLYNFPSQFLNDNKDLIYSNKHSEIYK